MNAPYSEANSAALLDKIESNLRVGNYVRLSRSTILDVLNDDEWSIRVFRQNGSGASVDRILRDGRLAQNRQAA